MKFWCKNHPGVIADVDTAHKSVAFINPADVGQCQLLLLAHKVATDPNASITGPQGVWNPRIGAMQCDIQEGDPT